MAKTPQLGFSTDRPRDDSRALTGKTIKKVDTSCINQIKLIMEDNSEFVIDAESTMFAWAGVPTLKTTKVK